MKVKKFWEMAPLGSAQAEITLQTMLLAGLALGRRVDPSEDIAEVNAELSAKLDKELGS